MEAASGQPFPWEQDHQIEVEAHLPEGLRVRNMAGESAINIQKILNNGESPAAIVLSSAILWHSAYADLASLDNRCWIESTVADFYLASLWHDMHGNSPSRLVTIFRDSHNLEVPLEVIDRYRRTHYFPANGPCPIVPVGFLVHDPGTAHFFPVIFDYGHHCAYILGRRISNNNPDYNPDWKAWGGPERWKIIADLHLWDAGDLDNIFVITRDWPQNGYDCGPIACALLQKVIEDGMEETWEFLSTVPIGSRPPIPCGHILRLNMLAHIRQRSMVSFNDYMHFTTSQPVDWEYMELDDETILQMQEGGNHVRDGQLLRSLSLASSSCKDCHAFIAQCHTTSQDIGRGADDNYQEEQDDPGLEQEQLSEEEQSLCNPEQIKTLMSLIRGHKILHGARLHRSLRPAKAICHPSKSFKNDVEKVDVEGEQEQQRHRAQLSTSARASRKQVQDWRLGTIGRIPRASKPPPLEAYKGQRFIEHDYDYDDYDHGPTLEMLQQPEVYSILTHPFQKMTQAPSWIMWRDHGYRLLADSFQMFYLAQPAQIMDHIMSVGDADPPSPIIHVSQMFLHILFSN